MKFKSNAICEPSRGLIIKDPSIVVPDQSLSLEEILDRFTRGEPLSIGREATYDEGDYDLEKMRHMDLTEKDEYIEKQKEIRKKFESEQKERDRKEKERLDKLAVDKLAADKKAAESSAAKPSKKP